MKYIVGAGVLVLGVAACASPAQQVNFQNSKSVSASFDESWEVAIGYFAENNISIKTLEKDSGLVVAEVARVPALTLNELADCGSLPAFSRNQSGSASYNVFIREEGTGSRVQVNAAFDQSFYNGVTGSLDNGVCYSKGVFEAALLSKF